MKSLKGQIKSRRRVFLVGCVVLVVMLFESITAYVLVDYGSVILAINKTKANPNPVEIVEWNSVETYGFIHSKFKNGYNYDCFVNYFAFESDLRKENMIETNPEEYVGDVDFDLTHNKHTQASLFFHNNNYYVFYTRKYENELYYEAQNCYSDTELCENTKVSFPTPVILEFSKDMFKLYHQFHENLVDELFQHVTFQDACKFYGRMSKEVATIDYKKEQILLDGYSHMQKRYYKDCVMLNFRNKTFSACNHGKWTEYDGKGMY